MNTNESKIGNQKMFSSPFGFKGRIRRTEYFLSYIMLSVWVVIASMLAFFLDELFRPTVIVPTMFMIFFYTLSVWFWCAQSCKRCHDRGNSGWYQLIPFYWLVLLFGQGEAVANKYGQPAK